MNYFVYQSNNNRTTIIWQVEKGRKNVREICEILACINCKIRLCLTGTAFLSDLFLICNHHGHPNRELFIVRFRFNRYSVYPVVCIFGINHC